MALQRGLLLLTTRACRTTSTVAMQVIAGVKPMDLEVVKDALVKRVRRNLGTVWDTYSFREKEMERFDEIVHLEMEKIKGSLLKNGKVRGKPKHTGDKHMNSCKRLPSPIVIKDGSD